MTLVRAKSHCQWTHHKQFVSQDDDDEKSVALIYFSPMISRSALTTVLVIRLWAVIEITAEYANRYKVKWAGVDPLTGKPWAQSWVAKNDCTQDLVTGWEMKKLKCKEMKARRRRLFYFFILTM